MRAACVYPSRLVCDICGLFVGVFFGAFVPLASSAVVPVPACFVHHGKAVQDPEILQSCNPVLHSCGIPVENSNARQKCKVTASDPQPN